MACFPRPPLFKWANISVVSIYSAASSTQGFFETRSCIISTWPSQIAWSVHSQQLCTQRTCICIHRMCLHSRDSGYSLKHGSNWGQEAKKTSPLWLDSVIIAVCLSATPFGYVWTSARILIWGENQCDRTQEGAVHSPGNKKKKAN